jgi:Zn-dependent protease with chaperone function
MATLYAAVSANKQKTWLLLTAFLIFMIGLGWVFAQAYGSPVILYIAVFIAVLQSWIAYFYSDRIALSIARAKKVEKRDLPEL